LRLLDVNADVVGSLEDLFSQRYKDRTSFTSQLSGVESHRFRRALYRLWLFSAAFGEDIFEEFVDEQGLQESREDQERFLDTYDTRHLREMEMVASFLIDVALWTFRAAPPPISRFQDGDMGALALLAGPQAIFKAYSDHSSVIIYQRHRAFLRDPYPDRHFFQDALGVVWVQRSFEEEYASPIILDEVLGEHDECRRCNTMKGVELWNITNWCMLKGYMHHTIHTSLKGMLRKNHTETRPLRATLDGMGYFTLMDQIFDVDPCKGDTLGVWAKEDWICLDCLNRLLEERLHLWWPTQKNKANVALLPNCASGFDCLKQTYQTDHALAYNHICEPLPGDDGSNQDVDQMEKTTLSCDS